MSAQIRELNKELLKAAGEEHDTRFRSWAKEIISVDASKSNGYAFEGDFINEGTVEVEIKPRLYLVMTTAGSRKYQTRTYTVVAMDADGNLAATDIQTTDKTRGWALRIRDQVAALLAEMEANESESVTITVTLTGTELEIWRALCKRHPLLSEHELIIGSLNLFEMKFRELDQDEI
jgi:hypothetical protein